MFCASSVKKKKLYLFPLKGWLDNRATYTNRSNSGTWNAHKISCSPKSPGFGRWLLWSYGDGCENGGGGWERERESSCQQERLYRRNAIRAMTPERRYGTKREILPRRSVIRRLAVYSATVPQSPFNSENWSDTLVGPFRVLAAKTHRQPLPYTGPLTVRFPHHDHGRPSMRFWHFRRPF